MKYRDYAAAVVAGTIKAPCYVKKQAAEFLEIVDGNNPKYCISEKKVKQVEGILKLLIMPTGTKSGQSLYECTCGYQWFLYVAALCVVYRSDTSRRRYQIVLLEIARKNFKTFTIAVLFILLFLLEPKFSKFFSVAPDGTISREVKAAVAEILKSSPAVYQFKNRPRFKILRDYIEFIPKESRFIPLNYSTSRMDSRLPTAFLADEVGALPNSYPIEAMKSGQTTIPNKLGFLISTKYPTANNPLEDEVAYSKRVLDGLEDDEARFSLLYEPDNPKEWITDDDVLRHANPVALEIPEIWEDLLKKRQWAIAVESARENFLTKHCNIIYQGVGTESFIDINDVKACKVEHIEWTGKPAYIGVDLSMTNDNCAVAIVSYDDDNNILVDDIAFIPEGRIEEKSKYEKIDYRQFINAMKCIACGYKTVDYSVIEKFVFDIEEKYGVEIMGIGYDRFNALSSAQKWDKKYNTIQVRQHSDTLHPVTKLLHEKIVNGEFQYTENKLLEINFENAKCTFDTNLNRYINKKKSNGKVDMVMAILNALFVLNNDVFLADNDVIIDVI